MTSFAHTGSTFEKSCLQMKCVEFDSVLPATSCSSISLTVPVLFTFKWIYDVIFVNRKQHKNGKRYVVFDDTLLKANVFLFLMALVSSKSDKKKWFYGVLKKYWRLSVTSGPRDLCDQASVKCFNLTYHITTPNIIAISLGFSKIFDLEITMNYIGKSLRRHYDVTSGPIDTKLNYSFIASNYVTV